MLGHIATDWSSLTMAKFFNYAALPDDLAGTDRHLPVATPLGLRLVAADSRNFCLRHLRLPGEAALSLRCETALVRQFLCAALGAVAHANHVDGRGCETAQGGQGIL